MSSFTTPLVVTPLDNGKQWKLTRAFTYHIGEETSKEKIVVPIGFITDFASVPRLLWPLIPSFGRYGKAAVLHDYLYSIQYKNSRSTCDDIFYEAMSVLDVKWWRKRLIYRGVRIGGWVAWNKYAKAKSEMDQMGIG